MKVYVLQNLKTKEYVFPLARDVASAFYKVSGKWISKDWKLVAYHSPDEFSLFEALYKERKKERKNEKTNN